MKYRMLFSALLPGILGLFSLYKSVEDSVIWEDLDVLSEVWYI